MSELKVYIGPAPDEKGLVDYYLKSEVDKVIAELKDDCAYWKMSEGNAVNAMHETEEYAMQLYKELRHQKYKRCLAMEKYCEAMRGHYLSYEEPKWFWYRKWSERWLELAKKFKEA